MLSIEPLGLLHGQAARDAIERRLALPLAGGPAAFSLVRLPGDPRGIVPVALIPAEHRPALARITAARPTFAGLPGTGPWVMAILNVTPDSFSDGGQHATTEAAIAAARAPVILMHMRGTPQTMSEHTSYADVAAEVVRELADRVAAAEAAGIARADIAIDPGIGFAKENPASIELLDRLPVLHNLGCRILAGVSRKRFIGALTGEPIAARRMPGSLAAALTALDRGATILRVHDVGETVQALRVWRGMNIS